MADRKEYELLFKLKAALGGNFNSAFSSALNTTTKLQNSLQKLNTITGKIDSYKKQETALEANRKKLADLTAEHDKLQKEISETQGPTDALRAKLERNEKQIAATTSKIEDQEARLKSLGSELSEAGVNTARLTEENERLAKAYDRVKSSQEEIARINTAIQKNNEAISQTKAQLTGTIGTIAALGAAIYAGPIKKSAEFEAQMSSVKAIIESSYGGNTAKLAEDMGQLSDLAKQMGATTKFTAAESGKALEYMAMAGWKANQMIGGLPGIMSLAAASGEELGSVSDIVTDALTAFRMSAEDAGRFADVLAQASSNANTNVGMMGATFQKVAPVAGALGYTVEDMSLGIGLMANASIKAEVAGTSLKTALANMAKPTKQMKTYMDRYGISLTNTDGSMKTFREVVDNLRDSLGGLSESEQVAAATAIFGKESFAGMLAIVNASDTDFQKLSDSINNAAGAAERMAEVKNDNLEGDIIKAKSALDGLSQAIGDSLRPSMRGLVQGATALISKLTIFINKNPELVQQIVKVSAGFLGFKAAALTAKLGFLELKSGFLTVQKGLATVRSVFALASAGSLGFSSTLKGVASSVAGYFGGIGSAAGGVGNAIAGIFSGTKIGNLFSGLTGTVGGAFTKLFSGIGGIATGAAGKIIGVFSKAGSAIAAGPLGKIGSVVGKGFSKLTSLISPLKKLGGAVLGPFGGVLGKILPIVGVISAIIAVVQILRDNLDKVREVVGKVFGDAGLEVFDKIVSVITNIGDTIKGIFSESNLSSAREAIRGIFGDKGADVFDTFISIIQTIGGVVREFIAFVDQNVKPVISELFSFIVENVLPQIAAAFVEWGPTITSVIQTIWQIVQTVATAIMNIISALMPTIKNLIGTALETIKSVVGGALTAINGLLNVFAGIFTGDWSRVWNGVKDIFSGIWEAIKGIAKGALNGIIDIINGLIGGLNKLTIPDWVPGIGGKGINIPLIPKFAKGTPRTPDSFIAGEAGAELVTNARNRTVYTAAQTDALMRNNETIVAVAPMLQAAIAAWKSNGGGLAVPVGATVERVTAPTLSAGAMQKQTSVVIHSAPVFHVGSEAEAEDIEELLRQHDEHLMQEFDDRLNQREEDERRTTYD